MAKIELFVVTFNRPTAMNETLQGIYDSDFFKQGGNRITVINNGSKFRLDPEFKDVRVLHNQTRLGCSHGNLSENYNQALLWGFGSLDKPQANIVIHIQDDCCVAPDWTEELLNLHEKYSFIVGNFGDNLVSYTPDAVRKIGMWDENFCGIQHKEADYWIRALIWNKDHTMLNDHMHNRRLHYDPEASAHLDVQGHRAFSWVGGKLKRGQDDGNHVLIKRHAVKANNVLRNYFFAKWSRAEWKNPLRDDLEGWLVNWPDEFVDHPPTFPREWLTPIKYPWFESGIENRTAKGYLS